MTMKEAEEQTGLARSNIRFYEKEKLIEPLRNESNGYRDYSEKDIADIKKIACLRTLGISIEDIRSLISEKVSMREVLEKQNAAVECQIADLNRVKAMCRKMLDTEDLSYENLDVERYVPELKDYWSDNKRIFKLDSVSFLYLWGSFITWAALTVFCLAAGLLSYGKLPPEIPVQWNNGAASALADRKVIFAYPIVCVAIRYLLRPCIYAKLQMGYGYREMIAEYLTNYLCFLALTTEIFSILFIYGAVKNIVIVLAVDTVVFIGLLFRGLIRMDLRK